ncbi:glutathione S-transferase family protein [Agrobacterium tumefaciens]|uniref:glutathione S-transferase family protein n=1 Tax=Agrobacterium tumefaciens TaxID=358 RepID=UPI001F3EDC02
MLFYDANVASPNPATVRLFILERGHLDLDVQSVDIINLENRAKTYRETVNSRGELPALRLDNGQVITEITAICRYLDEVAKGGRSLFGATAEERAITDMWTRRVYLEIIAPFVAHWRGTEDAVNFYRGNRLPMPEAKLANRLEAERGFNQLEDDMDGKTYICGDEVTMADILLYAFMFTMRQALPWLNVPGRKDLAAWFEKMSARPAAKLIEQSLPTHIAA